MYAATGLETSAYAAALWLAVWAVAAARARLAWISGAAVAALRPEAIVLGLAAAPWLRRPSPRLRTLLLATLGAAAVMAAARLAYFGAPLPRSVTVKGFSAAAGPEFGVSYLARAAAEWWPLLVGVPFLLSRRRDLLPALAGAGAWTFLVVARGGDWMPGSRYLAPLLVLLVAGAAASRRIWATASVIAMAVWGCLQLAPVADPAARLVGSSWRAMAEHRVQSRWWEALGASLGSALPRTTTLASGPSGALPYASGLPTVDMFGLCTVVTEEREGGTGHRLWGLRQAAGRRDIIYTGAPVPQIHDARAVVAAAEASVAGIPEFRLEYQPLVLLHSPESQLDVVADAIWVRPAVAGLVVRWLGRLPAGVAR